MEAKLSLSKIEKIEVFEKDKLSEINNRLKLLSKELTNKESVEEINVIINKTLPKKIVYSYVRYLDDLNTFIPKYLNNVRDRKFEYVNIKRSILRKLEIISQNLVQLKINARGINKYIKEDPWVIEAKNVIEESQHRIKRISSGVKIDAENDDGDLWIRIYRVKNGTMIITPVVDLDEWEEITELINIANAISKKKRKKDRIVTASFLDLDRYLNDLLMICIISTSHQ